MESPAALIQMQQTAPPPPPIIDDEDGEADDAFDFPEKRHVEAGQWTAEKVRGPCSIFDLAGTAARLKAGGRFGHASGFLPSAAPAPTVQREPGVTKVTGGQYPANRWTEERQEQERQRRARQKPPRPTKRARTKSKKLRDLIGGEEFHDD